MLIVYLSLLSEETSKINASEHFTGSFINAVPPNDTYHLNQKSYIVNFNRYALLICIASKISLIRYL